MCLSDRHWIFQRFIKFSRECIVTANIVESVTHFEVRHFKHFIVYYNILSVIYNTGQS